MAVPRLNRICITQWPLAIWVWLWRDSAPAWALPGPSLFKWKQYWRLGDMFYNTTNVLHLEPTDSEASVSLAITQLSNTHCHTRQDYSHTPLAGIKQSTLIWLEWKRSEAFLPRQLRQTLTTINKTDYNIQSIWNHLHFKWQQLMDWNPRNDSTPAPCKRTCIWKTDYWKWPSISFGLCRGLDSCTFSPGINPIKMPFLPLRNTETPALCQRNAALK